ncbi:MAG: tryptophan synthase subunit beta [Muribaculaceae bacterium]|nr:tryptophan synthase subunit beta [Muribaculaceae bacterium]
MNTKQFTHDIIIDENGYYGRFGGAYIPEVLRKNIDDLRLAYAEAIKDEEFQAEFHRLLRDYVGRPSPLYKAERLSRHYGTNIYLKREDLNHTGAHKINNAIGQALLARRMGKRRIIAETGAGQHGVATATVCALLGMECTIYMGALDVERQRPNVERMKMLGAEVVAVHTGGAALTDAVDTALAEWCDKPDETFYMIGSAVGPHPYPAMVARFQSVISEEIARQLLEMEGRDTPDCVIACIGGGSNAAGAFYHFINRPEVRLIAAEAGGQGPESGKTAATLTIGHEGVLHGSRTMIITDADGNVAEPYSISAGLDYPGIGPLQAYLSETGRTEVIAINDVDALKAGHMLTRMEGIIPAIESAHALAVLDKVKFKPDDIVVVNVSGRGDKDLATYLA